MSLSGLDLMPLAQKVGHVLIIRPGNRRDYEKGCPGGLPWIVDFLPSGAFDDGRITVLRPLVIGILGLARDRMENRYPLFLITR